MADGTDTQVVTCMINRWRAKINWKEIYNVRNPPGEGGEKEREYGSNSEDLGNHCNLSLKKEEEH